jgi:NADPH:quinone reductase-like Zn-dependent oxidoreductase
VVPPARFITLPDGLDDVTAAAMSNPGMSSWAAFTERAHLKPGETVLLNGATGTSGRLGAQIARHLGASKIIATGRSPDGLRALENLGVDVTIQLDQDEKTLKKILDAQFAAGVDVILDFIWGRSMELMLTAAAGAGTGDRPVRFVQIGALSGAEITLPSAVLRSAAVELMGSGLGSVSYANLLRAIDGVFRAAGPEGFEIATTPVPLSDFDHAWPQFDGKRRTVFTLDPPA